MADVVITHPGRIVFPERGLRKLDLAAYYGEVAERLLPHVEGRPLTLVRCPGTREDCFYQKNWERMGGGLETARDGRVHYPVVRDPRGLLTLIQYGALELHPWGSRVERLEKPDLLVFDLDPGPDVPWPAVRDAARELRGRLGALDLESFLKTSGGKGLHLVLPLRPEKEWDVVKAFAGNVAKELAARAPERYVATMTKAARRGKVFIDWFRNGRGATAVAPWSVRARPGAPIAAPISWSALDRISGADAYRIGTLPAGDPWAGFFDVRQKLPRKAA